jgi:ferric-dicitrate binding protein FerR (iron transport regulator)
MENRRPHHDIPPAGMGGTYQDWLHYQEKQERLARRMERQEQALRTARNRSRAAKAAKIRRKRRHAQQAASTLRGVLVAGVAVVLLAAGTVIKQVWRTSG